jgi:hypothetical protein
LKSKEEKFREEVKENNNLIFHELSKFVGFFNCFGLPYEQANKTLLELCDQYLIEKHKT